MVRLGDITHPQPDQIASAQLAIDGEVKQRQVAYTALKLRVDSNGPDFVSLQGRLLARNPSFVPGHRGCVMREGVLHGCSPLRQEGELL
jgi:hypothetical protein